VKVSISSINYACIAGLKKKNETRTWGTNLELVSEILFFHFEVLYNNSLVSYFSCIYLLFRISNYISGVEKWGLL